MAFKVLGNSHATHIREWPGTYKLRCNRSLPAVLHNMHREGSSPGPGRAWGGAFMLAKVLGNSHATHESGLALINCIVADHSQLCYTICTIKSPPQALRSLYGI